jgi:hypothetical protein
MTTDKIAPFAAVGIPQTGFYQKLSRRKLFVEEKMLLT